MQTLKRNNIKRVRHPQCVKLMKSCRRLMKTVIGQLVARFNIEKVWTKGLCQLTSRVTRKTLAHITSDFINRKIKLDSSIRNYQISLRVL